MALGAVVFVRDLAKLSTFYAAVLDAEPLPESSGEGWVAFAVGEGSLWLHAVSPDVPADERPGHLREDVPVKLVLPVRIDAARTQRIEDLGGRVILRPWGRDVADPEGNIFAIEEHSAI